jgi:hypothetical protein
VDRMPVATTIAKAWTPRLHVASGTSGHWSVQYFSSGMTGDHPPSARAPPRLLTRHPFSCSEARLLPVVISQGLVEHAWRPCSNKPVSHVTINGITICPNHRAQQRAPHIKHSRWTRHPHHGGPRSGQGQPDQHGRWYEPPEGRKVSQPPDDQSVLVRLSIDGTASLLHLRHAGDPDAGSRHRLLRYYAPFACSHTAACVGAGGWRVPVCFTRPPLSSRPCNR